MTTETITRPRRFWPWAVLLMFAGAATGLWAVWRNRADEISVSAFWEALEAGRFARIEVYNTDRLSAYWNTPPAGQRPNVLVSFPGVGAGNYRDGFVLIERRLPERDAGPE